MNGAVDTIQPARASGRAPGLVQRLAHVARWVVAALFAFAYLWSCRRVGARARALGRPLLRNGGGIEIGEDVLLESHPEPVELATVGTGRLIVGHGVRIGPGSRLSAARYVEIGDRVRVGAGCVVSDETPRSTPDERASIWIGDSVVLGDGVTVGPGTVIGAGAVIAAGCTVSGVVPPFAFVDGVRVTAAAHPGSPAPLVRPPVQPTPAGSSAYFA